MKPETIKRFWAKVNRFGADQCWEWTAAKNRAGGYGRIRCGDVVKLAHHIFYELHHGPIQDGRYVLHSCDNPSCVNPAHLHLGTHQDNMREKIERERQSKGENHCSAKLTESDVLEIRKLYSQGGVTQQQIARQFGVKHPIVSKIINRNNWTHV